MKTLPRLLLILICLAPGQQAVLLAQFSHYILTKEKPWTKLPEVKGNDFRFVITGDITGGEEPGVFAYALERINELSPDFVITVGDLIDGYTNDSNRIEKQWDSFMSTLRVLEMPFFFTAGNHDITNQLMKEVWTKRFGPEYYSFSVGKALFLVLNISEAGTHNFSEAQFSYVRKEVETHPENDPVFVIQHYPLWEIQDNNNINNLLTLLKNKNAYWFCGHEHRYLHKYINGQPHYMLAGLATGGPGMKGPAFGEYHNLMMVTVREREIKIANLDLEGLLPLNVVNETTDKQVKILRSGEWADLTPVFSLTDSVTRLETCLLLSNPCDYPIEINGSFDECAGIDVNPIILTRTLQSNEKLSIPVIISTNKKVSIWEIPEIKVKLNVNSLQPGNNLRSSISKSLTLDYLKRCAAKTDPSAPVYTRQLPAQVDEEWDWKGFEDAGFEIKTQYDDKYLLVEISVTDDALNTALHNAPADKLIVWFATDTALNVTDYLQLDFVAGISKATFNLQEKQYKNIITECKIIDNKLCAKVSIPLKVLKEPYFRLNLSYLDVDDPMNMDHATLWWKPRWGSLNNYHGAGLFMLD